jgi:hypothetical protein
LNETTTVFVGGTAYPRGIITFDWSTMSYTKQATELVRNRTWTWCAILENENSEKVVVIAGGFSAGTEIWNPLDGSIKLVSEDFPPVTSISTGHAKLVPINFGSELLLYGGYYNGTNVDDVWKFSGSNLSWSEFGRMLSIRDDHVVIPVDDIECPK